MACHSQTLDLFVSRKPDDSSSNPLHVLEYTRDSVFAMCVWSVEINPTSPTYAMVVDKKSEWIMPRAFTQACAAATTLPETYFPWRDIKVGDVVHVGSTHTIGYSDYLVVVEVKDDVARLYNTTDATISCDALGSATIASAAFAAASNLGTRAIRVNKAINYTALPTHPTNLTALNALAAQTPITNANWEEGYRYLSAPQNLWTEDSGKTPILPEGTEQYFYPLYRVLPWVCTGPGSKLQIDLARSTKKLTSITLKGYHFSLVGDLGHHANSEKNVLDNEYYVMRIRELADGRVISNNPAANGSFAVLQVGTTLTNDNGCYEYSRYSDEGIATLDLPTPRIIGSLTLELYDRLGNAAQLGHGHFWFSVTVEG